MKREHFIYYLILCLLLGLSIQQLYVFRVSQKFICLLPACIFIAFLCSREDIIDILSWKKNKQEEVKPFLTRNPIEMPDIEIQRAAYINLSKHIANKKMQDDTKNFFENLKDYTEDEEYSTTLNFVLEYLETNDYDFIRRIDWKESVEELDFFIKNVLVDIYNITDLKLPEYGEDDSVANDDAFENFDACLRKVNLQLGFMDTHSDEYIFFVHKIDERGLMEDLINKLGYEYFERKFGE